MTTTIAARKKQTGEPTTNRGHFGHHTRPADTVSLVPAGWSLHGSDAVPASLRDPSGSAEYRFNTSDGDLVVTLDAYDEWDPRSQENDVYTGRIARNAGDLRSATHSHGALVFDTDDDYYGFTRGAKKTHVDVVVAAARRFAAADATVIV